MKILSKTYSGTKKKNYLKKVKIAPDAEIIPFEVRQKTHKPSFYHKADLMPTIRFIFKGEQAFLSLSALTKISIT